MSAESWTITLENERQDGEEQVVAPATQAWILTQTMKDRDGEKTI